MTQRIRRALQGCVLVLLVSGCASKTKPPTPRPTSEPCAGHAVLVVDNSSGYDLDVVEARSIGGGRSVIGTVGQGHHELTLRSEGGYYYFTRRSLAGATQVSESMRASASDRVRMARECRTF